MDVAGDEQNDPVVNQINWKHRRDEMAGMRRETDSLGAVEVPAGRTGRGCFC
jgi:hypothetical protein